MKPTHDLFDLVKSLTKTEKRYVSLYLSASLHGSNKNSLALFKAINRQETYDDALLKKQSGKTIAARFSLEKSRLFELILESMQFYYRDATVEKQIFTLRHQSSFLFQKKLQSPAWWYFRKANELAEAHEAYPLRLMMAYMENIQVRRSSPGSARFSLEERLAQQRHLVEQLDDDLALHTLYTQALELDKRYGSAAGPPEMRKQLEQIMSHPLMDRSKKLHSFSARVSRQEIRTVYFTLLGDQEQAFQCVSEQVVLFEESPLHIGQNYGRYCDTLENQLHLTLVLHRYDLFEKLLGKTRKAVKGLKKYVSYDVDYLDFVDLQQMELIVYKIKADAKQGAAFLAETEKRFQRYRQQMKENEIIVYLFLLGTYRFYLGDLKKALAWYNELIDSTSPAVRPDYQCLVRLAKLLLHYDLGHTDLLPNLVASATRLLNKQELFGVHEKQLLAFFKKGEVAGRKELLLLQTALRNLSPVAFGHEAGGDFDYAAWIESKLTGKPLQVTVAERSFKFRVSGF